MEEVDILIVGAGISGIGAAVHLQRDCPDKSIAIVEGRSDLGGTWDLFKYPGIRSDSDMHTFGYDFKPWVDPDALAEAHKIKGYLAETADEYRIRERIRFDTRVTAAEWSSADARWTVITEGPDGAAKIRCAFLYLNTGYYNYEQPFRPDFPGESDFSGPIIHPQHWPEDLDYAGKNVVVIGSGATAVTIVPSMAGKAKKVTMLQRSPTYIVSLPKQDRISNVVGKLMGEEAGYKFARWKNIRFSSIFYKRAIAKPKKVAANIIKRAKKAMPGVDVDRHFTPSYDPWTQRLCLVPDGDLFEAINSGQAEVVTDTIDRFEKGGIRLSSGKTLPADIIVTATGLNLRMFGGVDFTVDGEAVRPSDCYAYKGALFTGLPNFTSTLGYTNASWTLKADILARYVGRLLNLMDEKGVDIVEPKQPPAHAEFDDVFALNAGYVLRGRDQMPKGTTVAPWHQPHDYLSDRVVLTENPVDDGTLIFRRKGEGVAANEREDLPQAAE